jgi:phosphoribosylformimino-5-aminoimidazole carboxamide ribotide isomerase
VILYPAVDIRDGKAVRLDQGDFAAETVYQDDPFEAARTWVEEGARFLHVVDLDGARTGSPANLHHVRRIAEGLPVPVEVGGGLRALPAVRDALRAGAARVILGTAAFNDVDFLDECIAAYGERVVVSVDARGGFVTTAGWTETTQMPAEAVIERLIARGVKQFVYSNVDRDGMMDGVDVDEVKRIADVVRGRFLYSGGVSTLEDLAALRDLRQVNLAGVIVGKALFERRFTVAEGQAVLDGKALPPTPVGSEAPEGEPAPS